MGTVKVVTERLKKGGKEWMVTRPAFSSKSASRPLMGTVKVVTEGLKMGGQGSCFRRHQGEII
jgi:hypothetical protein